MHVLQNALRETGPDLAAQIRTKKLAKEIVVVVDDEDEEEGEKAAKASLPTSLDQALTTAFSLDLADPNLATKTLTSAQARGPTVANGSTRRLRRETRAEFSSESVNMEVVIPLPTKRLRTHVRAQAAPNRTCDAACIAVQEGENDAGIHLRLAHAKNDVVWSWVAISQNRTTMTMSQRLSSIRHSAHRRLSPSINTSPAFQPVRINPTTCHTCVIFRPYVFTVVMPPPSLPDANSLTGLPLTSLHAPTCWDRGTAAQTESPANVTQSSGRQYIANNAIASNATGFFVDEGTAASTHDLLAKTPPPCYLLGSPSPHVSALVALPCNETVQMSSTVFCKHRTCWPNRLSIYPDTEKKDGSPWRCSAPYKFSRRAYSNPTTSHSSTSTRLSSKIDQLRVKVHEIQTVMLTLAAHAATSHTIELDETPCRCVKHCPSSISQT